MPWTLVDRRAPASPQEIATMPQAPDWKRMLEAGSQFTEMRRSQARALAADLVAQGHLAREQMAQAVEELLEQSRRRTEDLRQLVQKEVQRQLGALGLATKADLAALERRLTAASRESKKAPAKKKCDKQAEKKPAKKAAAKTARKAG
jgi:polyhydroxyalkanoate synthesis regulator phasin